MDANWAWDASKFRGLYGGPLEKGAMGIHRVKFRGIWGQKERSGCLSGPDGCAGSRKSRRARGGTEMLKTATEKELCGSELMAFDGEQI